MRHLLPIAWILVGCGVGCGPKVDPGIFEAGLAGPTSSAASDGPEPATGDSGGSDDTAPDDVDPEPGPGSTGAAGTDGETGSSGAPEDLGCPDAVGPSTYQCPAGFEFWTSGGVAQCRIEALDLPATDSVFDYCQYLDQGVLGFGWTLAEAPSGYVCPVGSRDAPNATLGYCLWEDFELPTGAIAACNALLAEHWLGFQWPCPG